MTLDYYYGDQAEQFSFYRIPKLLFTDKRFKDLSAEAKILYGLLLDRMSLSAKNGWLDQEGRVYIVYTVEDIMDALSCASQKAMKLLNELDEKCGLIERKRQGLGKPNLIYVKNFVAAPESKFKNGENQNSGVLKIKTQEFPKSKGSNTEKNNTDLNDTESLPFTSFRGSQKRESKRNDAERRSQYRELIMENISYDVLLLDLPYDKEIVEEILELIVDTVCTTKETVRISGDDKPAEVVRSRFLKLDSEHIRFVVSCMKENTTKIKNIRQYLLATLYNASLTMTSYAQLSDSDAEQARDDLIKTKGFFILPSQLFCSVRSRAPLDENLNETLEAVFQAIEDSAKGSDSEANFSGLFDDIDVNSNKLGGTVAERNKRLVKLMNGVGDMKLGDYRDNTIDAFGDAYEYLMGMYASNAGKSGGEYFTPQEVSELLTRIAVAGKTEVNKVYDEAVA